MCKQQIDKLKHTFAPKQCENITLTLETAKLNTTPILEDLRKHLSYIFEYKNLIKTTKNNNNNNKKTKKKIRETMEHLEQTVKVPNHWIMKSGYTPKYE